MWKLFQHARTVCNSSWHPFTPVPHTHSPPNSDARQCAFHRGRKGSGLMRKGFHDQWQCRSARASCSPRCQHLPSRDSAHFQHNIHDKATSSSCDQHVIVRLNVLVQFRQIKALVQLRPLFCFCCCSGTCGSNPTLILMDLNTYQALIHM